MAQYQHKIFEGMRNKEFKIRVDSKDKNTIFVISENEPVPLVKTAKNVGTKAVVKLRQN